MCAGGGNPCDVAGRADPAFADDGVSLGDHGDEFLRRSEIDRQGREVAVVTNDLVTREDAERLKKGGLIEPGRVLAVETGACPHTAIREDPTLNIQCADELCDIYPGLSAVLLESGGDNLASTFSLELVDYWMFVIDVAGGGDIPRKKGPGVVKADLLIINKVDLAPFVGVDLERMKSEAVDVRNGRPVIMTNCASGYGISEVMSQLQQDVLF